MSSKGCGDSSCLVAPPPDGRMRTNGGCRCFGGLGLRHRVRAAAAEVERLTIERDEARDQRDEALYALAVRTKERDAALVAVRGGGQR